MAILAFVILWFHLTLQASPYSASEYWKSLGWKKVNIVSKTNKVKSLIHDASKIGIAVSYHKTLKSTNKKFFTYLENPENYLEELHDILLTHLKPFTVMVEIDQGTIDSFLNFVGSSNVSTAFYTLKKGQLSVVYTNHKWSQVISNTVTIRNNLSFYEKYNFHGMPISSITLSWQAWFWLNRCDSVGKACSTGGIMADFMDILKDMYNFTWYSDKDINNNWGYATEQFPNGTTTVDHYSGVLRGVMSREYDMSLANWNHYLDRNELVDTTFCLADLKTALYLANKRRTLDVSLFIRPFTMESWGAGLGICVLFIAVCGMLNHFEKQYSMPVQLLAFVIGMSFLMVHAFYGGASTMFYSTPQHLPFNGIYEALESYPLWKLVTISGFKIFYENMKLTSGVERLLTRIEQEKESIMKRNLSEALDMLKFPGHFVHAYTLDLAYYLQINNITREDLALTQTIPETSGNACLILSKYSPFLPMFNDGILKLRQTGIIQLLIRQHINILKNYPEAEAQTEQMVFGQIFTIFALYGLCSILCLIALIVERGRKNSLL